jgi:hypothetical protein
MSAVVGPSGGSRRSRPTAALDGKRTFRRWQCCENQDFRVPCGLIPAQGRGVWLLLSKRAEQRNVCPLRPGMSLVGGDTPVLGNPPIDKAIDRDAGHHDRMTVPDARK